MRMWQYFYACFFICSVVADRISLDSNNNDRDKTISRRSVSAVAGMFKSSRAGSASSPLNKSNRDVQNTIPWNSHQPDPKLVLVYLQKNVFDNTGSVS